MATRYRRTASLRGIDCHIRSCDSCGRSRTPIVELAGIQWHPEVMHTERGQQVLENFLFNIAGCTADWTAANIIDESVLAIQQQVGGKHIICGLSGGVDSAVAAALVQRAVGSPI